MRFGMVLWIIRKFHDSKTTTGTHQIIPSAMHKDKWKAHFTLYTTSEMCLQLILKIIITWQAWIST